jgi:hypothetical protein
MGESMKTEFKNGDPVIRDDDGKEYNFIGMSRSGMLENNRGEKLDCVIERNNFLSYAITSHLKLKPETVTHPGGEYPKPLSSGDLYILGFNKRCLYKPSPAGKYYTAIDKPFERKYIVLGLAHTTREAAIAHAKVIYQIKD